MAGLHLRTLGGFEARLGRRVVRLPRKAQALLAYLALAPGTIASRASLATLLWGDGTEDEARNNLRQVLFRIRRSLGSASPALILDGDAVSLKPELVDADVLRFQRLAAAGEVAALEEAAALYRGDLLSGLAVVEASFEDWLRGERARLRELGIDVLSRLLARRLEAKSFERAIQTALQLLALDPLQEHVHRALMRAYASDGRRPAALRQYQLCVDVLQRELQAEPEPETRSLYLEVLRQPRSACAPAALSVPVPASPAPRPRPLSTATPLVGRDAERKRLVQELAAAREGRGRVVAILGEAGVGKTRMSQELVAEAAAEGWLVLEGCAHETERELPFGLWVAVLRSAGVANEGVIADLAPAWRHALAPLFPEVIRERARRAPTEDPLRLFEALTHLMRTLAVRQPLLVLVEDFHWADATSVRFLAFLGRRLGEAPICVVATARAEDAGGSGAGVLGSALAELETGGQLTEIALAPLWRAAAEQLVAALTPRGRPRPSSGLLERIWRMSEGNAFVVVEVMRSLGPRSPESAGPDLALPEGVRRLIMDRVARLSPPARDMLAVASVVGRDMSYALLRDAAGLEDALAADALEELVRRRMLQQIGGDVDADPGGFGFAHDRIREATLQALLPPRRRLLHAAVARALESLHAGALDEHCAALAFHCRQAEWWQEAIDYASRASLVAAARGAFRTAVSLLDQALDMVGRLAPGAGRDERAVDLRLALADRAMVLGEFDLVERTLLEALDLAAGDEQRTAFARTVLAHRDYNVRNMHRGSALAEQALAAAERLGPGAGIIEARAAFISGAIRMTRGEHPAAIAHFHHAIRASGADPSTMVTIGLGLCHVAGRAWLGNSLAELGRFDEAIPLAREAVDRADAARNIFSMAWARAFLGRVQLARGDLEPAMAALVESQEMIDRYEIGLIGRLSVILLAHAHVLAGDARTAIELARRGPRIWPTALLAEGESLLAAGSLAEAEAAVAQGLSVARAEGERGNESTALELLGEIHERRGALARAREFYAEALAIATALGLRPREAHHRRGLGRALARAGESEEGRAQLSAALTLYGDMGMTRWIEPTRSELLAVAPEGVSESR